MKDFADVPNAVGTFPDVTAIDCSGPGEVDGTADIADTLTDDWGWKQALLNDQGITPDDTAEADGDSQILDALKMLSCKQGKQTLISAVPNSGSWELIANGSEFHWKSLGDEEYLLLPLNLPKGLTLDISLYIWIKPGAIRSGTNRVSAQIAKENTDSFTLIGSPVYDNGTTALPQVLQLSTTGESITSDGDYYIIIKSGSDGSSNFDELYYYNMSFDLS